MRLNVIPEYFAQQKAQTSRLPRAPARQLADTGAKLEAAGIAGFGKAVLDISSDILDKMIEERTETQFLEGASVWERANTEFFTGLAKDQDFENYGKKYKAFTKSLSRQITKKGLTTPAKRHLQAYMITRQLTAEKRLATLVIQKQKDYSRASGLQSVMDFEMALDTPGATSALDHLQEIGSMSAEETLTRKQQVRGNIDWYRGLMLVDTVPGEFMELADADADGKIDFTFLPGLTPELKLQLKAKARTEHGRRLASFKDKREQETNAEQGRLMDLARTDQLTDDIIRGSALDEFGVGSKDTFYKIIDAQAQAAIEEKDVAFKESDQRVKAGILDRIWDPSVKIVERDISSLVGKGLSTDDAARIIGNMGLFKDPWFHRVDMFFKNQLGWDGAYEKFQHPLGGISYKLVSDQLFTAIETGKLRGKDIYDRGTILAIPHIVDYWENVLGLEKPEIERMIALLKGGLETAEPEKKKPAPSKKKLKSIIDPEGIFQ